MDLFTGAKAVRLRSHLDKFLVADDDKETIRQSRNGSGQKARWAVELIGDKETPNLIRLKSCHGKYLTASDQPFLLGMTGKKVLQQNQAKNSDLGIQWEPIRDGFQWKFKSWCGKFLRANGGTPPWRNTVTHDEPHSGSTANWVLWDVEVIGLPDSGSVMEYLSSVRSFSSVSEEMMEALSDEIPGSDPQSPVSVFSSFGGSVKSPRFSVVSTRSPKLLPKQSTDSNSNSPPKSEGRTMYYHIADESGDVEDQTTEGFALNFKGSSVEELTQKLMEETGLDEIVVCTRSPLNGNLYPLRLRLPPNNADMHVVVVPVSSIAAKDYAKQSSTL